MRMRLSDIIKLVDYCLLLFAAFEAVVYCGQKKVGFVNKSRKTWYLAWSYSFSFRAKNKLIC